MAEYLRVREVADILAVSEQTVRKMVKDGTLRAVRIGKRSVRIPCAAVENFTGSQKSAAEPPGIGAPKRRIEMMQ